MPLPSSTTTRPTGLLISALAGIAWNVFGIFQFASQLASTPTALMGKGMTPLQADLYAHQPLWMTVAFAIGAGGGAAGAALLLARRALAVPVLAASLIGYVALYLGDVFGGMFAAFGLGQVVVLTIVGAIAAMLLTLARWAERRGLLR